MLESEQYMIKEAKKRKNNIRNVSIEKMDHKNLLEYYRKQQIVLSLF